MSFKHNNINVQSITLDGKKVESLHFNGVLVWPVKKEINKPLDGGETTLPNNGRVHITGGVGTVTIGNLHGGQKYVVTFYGGNHIRITYPDGGFIDSKVTPWFELWWDSEEGNFGTIYFGLADMTIQEAGRIVKPNDPPTLTLNKTSGTFTITGKTWD